MGREARGRQRAGFFSPLAADGKEATKAKKMPPERTTRQTPEGSGRRRRPPPRLAVRGFVRGCARRKHSGRAAASPAVRVALCVDVRGFVRPSRAAARLGDVGRLCAVRGFVRGCARIRPAAAEAVRGFVRGGCGLGSAMRLAVRGDGSFSIAPCAIIQSLCLVPSAFFGYTLCHHSVSVSRSISIFRLVIVPSFSLCVSFHQHFSVSHCAIIQSLCLVPSAFFG